MTPSESAGRGVLIITKMPFEEEQDGGSQRTANVVREIERRGFDAFAVSVLGAPRGDVSGACINDYVYAVKTLLYFLRTLSLSTLRWFRWQVAVDISRIMRSQDVEGVVVEYSQLSPYGLGLGIDGPVWLDMHNIESELMSNYAASAHNILRRTVALYEAWRLRNLEASSVSKFAGVSVVSDHDRRQCLAFGADPDVVVVAPNGFKPQNQDCQFSDDRSGAIFVASLDWRPNIDAARWLAKEVWPFVLRSAPDLRLSIVGKNPSSEVVGLRNSSIEVIGNVPDVAPYILASSVATAPLLSSGGTRLKIIEALSLGVPVVSTSLGALGLEDREGLGLVIEDEPDRFARRIVEMVSNAPNAADVRQSVADLTWEATLTRFGQSFSELMATSRRPGRI